MTLMQAAEAVALIDAVRKTGRCIAVTATMTKGYTVSIYLNRRKVPIIHSNAPELLDAVNDAIAKAKQAGYYKLEL